MTIKRIGQQTLKTRWWSSTKNVKKNMMDLCSHVRDCSRPCICVPFSIIIKTTAAVSLLHVYDIYFMFFLSVAHRIIFFCLKNHFTSIFILFLCSALEMCGFAKSFSYPDAMPIQKSYIFCFISSMFSYRS